MCLTTKTLIELRDKSFDKLFAEGAEKYADMTGFAIKFLRASRGTGDKVLMGDVVDTLKGSIDINPAFLAHLKERRLPPGSWSRDFAEYILEQLYPQPEL